MGGNTFWTDGDGNKGYYGADGSLIPFNYNKYFKLLFNLTEDYKNNVTWQTNDSSHIDITNNGMYFYANYNNVWDENKYVISNEYIDLTNYSRLIIKHEAWLYYRLYIIDESNNVLLSRDYNPSSQMYDYIYDINIKVPVKIKIVGKGGKYLTQIEAIKLLLIYCFSRYRASVYNNWGTCILRFYIGTIPGSTTHSTCDWCINS